MSQSPEGTSEYIGLIARHQTAIYAFIRSLVPSAADAQDIVQETNIALWSGMNRFTLGTDFYAWATHIAYRKVIDHSRRRKRHNPLVFDTDLAEQIAESVSAVASANASERYAALERCITKLPAEDERLTRLRYEKGLSIREISAFLNRSESGLQNTFSKIRGKLRLCVEAAVSPTAP